MAGQEWLVKEILVMIMERRSTFDTYKDLGVFFKGKPGLSQTFIFLPPPLIFALVSWDLAVL